MFLTLSISTVSQTFIKITSGAPVEDGGASRSVNWVDYDNDYDLDLFVSNSNGALGRSDFLYRNEGPGGNFYFQKISSGPVVNDNGRSDGGSFGDFDNDGDLDLFVVNWYNENNMFYENNGGPGFDYTEIFPGAPTSDGGLSETCSWGDYNNDGFLDLYVTNSGNAGVARRNFLYKNNGNKTFTAITKGRHVTDVEFSRGMNWVDYDRDGDVDIFVVNEEGQNNSLYKNFYKEAGVDSFLKITTGPLVNSGGNSISSSWGDIDNDGDLDVFIANASGQSNFLYLQNSDHSFTQVTSGAIVSDGGSSFGSAWGDFDNDGDLDLYVTNAYAGAPSVNFMYKNMLIENASLSFQKVTGQDVVTDQGDSYGVSWGDYDRDGKLDLFVAKTAGENENNALYKNDNSSGNHWTQFRCYGIASNNTSLGTVIRLKANINGSSVWQTRVLEGQSGYCGQSQYAHFGLKTATIIDSIVVEWPSGRRDIHTNVPTDKLYMLYENGTYKPLGFLTNQAPLITFELRDTTLLEDFDKTFIAKLGSHFFDPDSTSLIYSASNLSSGLLTLVSGDSLYVRSVQDYFGQVFIRVAASDGQLSIADTLAITITDVKEIIAYPTITNSILQNPASTKYGQVVVFSTVELSQTPEVTVFSAPTDSHSITMSAIANSKKNFNGMYEFKKTGEHTIRSKLKTFQGFDTTSTRTFVAALLKAKAHGVVTTPSRRVTLRIEKNQSERDIMILASEESTGSDVIYEFKSNSTVVGSMKMEFQLPPKSVDGTSLSFFKLGENDAWVQLESEIDEKTNTLLTTESGLGKFKITSTQTQNAKTLVKSFSLIQNYPNPFNPTTSIGYEIPVRGSVTLTIHNLLGQRIRLLISKYHDSGRFTATWDGKNDLGHNVASGVYLYRLQSPTFVQTKKMLLVK